MKSMAGKKEYRIFVGGLSWDFTERQLEHNFIRFGKILESQIMLGRDSGHPRGFGFITFADRRAMDDAIREMHGRELGDCIISVNKAQPKMGREDADHSYMGGYSSGGRGSYGTGDKPVAPNECFKCGRVGHFARDCYDCPTAGGGLVSPDKCFKCGLVGHFARDCDDCPMAPDKCFNCGRVGHFARDCDDCPMAPDKCFNCGRVGHFARDCDNCPTAGGGLVSPDKCFKCGRVGHFARECDDCPAAGGGLVSPDRCFRCGRVGHFARECDDCPAAGSGLVSPDRCFRCGRVGHFARECDDCPNGGRGPIARDKCFNCGRIGHFARYCPSVGDARGGNGGALSSCSRYGGSNEHGTSSRDRDHYHDDRYDGGRYGHWRCFTFNSKDDRYGGGDQYVADRYQLPRGDGFGDRYGASDRFPQNGYGEERGYNRDFGSRRSNGYATGGPARDDGRGYRNRYQKHAITRGRQGQNNSSPKLVRLTLSAVFERI